MILMFKGKWSESVKSLIRQTKSQRAREQKKYIAKHGNRWFFNESGRSTPYHEIGHVYADAKGLPDGFERDAERWYRESKCDMLKNPGEAWTEAWGAYHTDNQELPDYIAKYIDDVTLVKHSSIAKITDSAIMKSDKDLRKYLGKDIIKTDNQSIREWYYANVNDIPNQIDHGKTFEDQVRQAFDLRNKYKHEARMAMSDIVKAKELDETRPAPTFENLVESKMQRKGMTRDEALEDILKTASKTNANVNKEFGL